MLVVSLSLKSIFRWSGYAFALIAAVLIPLLTVVKLVHFEERIGSVKPSEFYSGLMESLKLLAGILRIGFANTGLQGALILLFAGVLLILLSHIPLIRRVDIRIRKFPILSGHALWFRVAGMAVIWGALIIQIIGLVSHIRTLN